MKKFNYQVERTENCILINATNWLENNSNLLRIHKINGSTPINYMTEVLDVNLINPFFKGSVSKGDFVLLSRVVSEVSQYRKYSIEGKKEFFDAPVMQILGKFKNNILSFDNLVPMFDKVIIRRLEVPAGILSSPSDNSMVGEVLKVGPCRFNNKWEKQPMTVKVGDKVLIRDNVTTRFTLDNKEYFATEESMVVGIFNNKQELSLENLNLINKDVLMEQYKASSLLNSTLLVAPDICCEDLDYSDLYNRDLFRVLFADNTLTEVKKNDILILDRDVTNYVFFQGTKYFIIEGLKDIYAKVQE